MKSRVTTALFRIERNSGLAAGIERIKARGAVMARDVLFHACAPLEAKLNGGAGTGPGKETRMRTSKNR